VGASNRFQIINDLDAGCGRFKETQVTVNNQMVMGTLMNICDHPQQVSVGKVGANSTPWLWNLSWK
jgi:hypothetical protein